MVTFPGFVRPLFAPLVGVEERWAESAWGWWVGWGEAKSGMWVPASPRPGNRKDGRQIAACRMEARQMRGLCREAGRNWEEARGLARAGRAVCSIIPAGTGGTAGDPDRTSWPRGLLPIWYESKHEGLRGKGKPEGADERASPAPDSWEQSEDGVR